MKVLIFIYFILLGSEFEDVKTLAEYTTSGIVQIETENGIGSGVIINTDGYIITNYHVIEESYMNNTLPQVINSEKKRYQVFEIVDIDEDLDLAILRTESLEEEISINISNPDEIVAGERIVVIGSPLGLQNYVTEGIISKYNTPIVFISAGVNPGNSGGAVLNMKGELVGIPTMQTEAQDMNYAICSRSIRYLLDLNKIKYNE